MREWGKNPRPKTKNCASRHRPSLPRPSLFVLCVEISSPLSIPTMTVEAVLTRKLGINFIDARNMTTQARLKLNIMGYPSTDQQELLIEEATRIFNARPVSERLNMMADRDSLDAAKEHIPGLSTHSSHHSLSHMSSHSLNVLDLNVNSDHGTFVSGNGLGGGGGSFNGSFSNSVDHSSSSNLSKKVKRRRSFFGK